MSDVIPLAPRIQTAALGALSRATPPGIALEITHIAIGDAAYDVGQGHLTLRHELGRYPVAAGKDQGDGRLHVEALADGPAAGWINEIGIIANGNILLAVWSHPTVKVGYKPAGQTMLLAFDLDLSELPPGSVTVVATAPDAGLCLASEFAQLAAGHLRELRRGVIQRDRLDTLERRASQAEARAGDLSQRLDAQAADQSQRATALGQRIDQQAATITEKHDAVLAIAAANAAGLLKLQRLQVKTIPVKGA
ncbi:hypothetical protein [Chitinimonas koreensis]|uniref:hypothetical protein n=1 Tax=Chitinimonas koreensis TaxID=356302 RepID=UPI0004147EF3|nr:hypothetical protein [Chitinimonas koreensis]QNM96393.1 phage tail protein [Chitinimonas koreensis]